VPFPFLADRHRTGSNALASRVALFRTLPDALALLRPRFDLDTHKPTPYASRASRGQDNPVGSGKGR